MGPALAAALSGALLTAAPGPGGRALSAEESAFCALEVAAIEKRARIFAEQGLPPAEVRRQNAAYEVHLAECRQRYRADQRFREEERRTLEEIASRTPPDANEVERARIDREIRVRRARQRRPDERSPAERRLLEDVAEEEGARRAAEASARDPLLRRQLLSAERCAHAARRDRARDGIAEEERLAALGNGDRTRLYFLRSELRRDEQVLARNAPELAAAGGALPCTDAQVAAVAHCVEQQAGGDGPDPDCEADGMENLLRILRGP